MELRGREDSLKHHQLPSAEEAEKHSRRRSLVYVCVCVGGGEGEGEGGGEMRETKAN
jgi:hypothetical protein